LGRLGWSLRRIQRAIGVRRETAATYLKAAGIGLRPPGGRGRPLPAKPAIEVITDSAAAKPALAVSTEPVPAKAASEVTTDFGAELAGCTTAPPEPQPGRSPSASACGPYRDAIALGLSHGRNAMAIWQDLVDTCGFAAGYQSVRRFVTQLRGKQSPEACAVIETAPGEELQVDYGTGPMVREPHSGKYRRTRLFVMTLGCSRKSVRLLVFRSSSQIWAQLHEKAFRRLGGCTRVVVLDNLREGVLAPDIYDPALNPLYRDVLQHYGAVPLPCRVADPDRKGKVESGVGHAQRTPLKGLRFESLEEAQTYLDHWEARWADTRIHGTTKRQVAGSPKSGRSCCRCPSNPSAITSTASAPYIWMAASKSKPLITARRRAGSAGLRCAAFWACCRWPRSTAPPPLTMPAPPPWKWASAITGLSAATWSGTPNCP
jgi:transposase